MSAHSRIAIRAAADKITFSSKHPYPTTEVRQALEDMFRQQGIERTSAPPPPARPSPPSRSPPAPKVVQPPPQRPQSYPSPPPHLPPPPMQHPLPPPPPGIYPPGFMIHGSPSYDHHEMHAHPHDRLSPGSPSSPAHSDSPSTPEFPIDPQLLQPHPKPAGNSNPQTPASPPPVTMSPFGPPPQRRGYEVSYMRGEH
ncbi:hypothetical protein DACRYDRAFT_114879 [Dacryopinax primogenitus]|uniref:Uncharacterized protein n=1 Tax=Dacryopinax primogenitus (strain DJM 731) TaxID=1858805 RepID=M5FZN5_DACPD|nr:uncharacterized protein DACRYDRAFT_114879 [Dacryopinax primogenitus]EJU03486.1 hypothetical protein DACRYDRAFT_114879 [Dacryopinax primogenitus]